MEENGVKDKWDLSVLSLQPLVNLTLFQTKMLSKLFLFWWDGIKLRRKVHAEPAHGPGLDPQYLH